MLRLLLALSLGLSLVLGGSALRADTLTIFAASSLKESLDAVTAAWEKESGNKAILSYAASSTLARQIAAGAPADVFISASEGWMDDVAARGLLDNHSRRDILGNQLVLIAPAPADPVKIADLPTLIGANRLAMAGVDSVPAGIYGKEALVSLGLWDALSPHVAQADNVRGALALIALGEAPFGIVYATDARIEPKVAVVAVFPPETHEPITYPAARLAGTDPAGAAFLDFLTGDTAQAIFAAAGFTRP